MSLGGMRLVASLLVTGFVRPCGSNDDVMEKTQIHTSDTPAKEAGTRIKQLLQQYAEEDVLLLFSGGSAFAIVEHIDASLFGEHVTISVLDERYTQDTEAQNTHHLLATSFWENARRAGVHHIDPRARNGETCERAACASISH